MNNPNSNPDSAYGELLNAVPDAVFVADYDGRILFVNRQATAMFGYERSELEGESIDRLVPERLRAGHVGHRAAYTGAPRVRPMGTGLDLHGLRKDGTEFPVEISLSPAPFGDASAVIASVRDVSARRQLEDERALALRQLQAIQRVTDTALGSFAVEELVPKMLERVRESLGADTIAILLLDDGGTRLEARWALGLEEEVEQHVRIPLGAGFAGRVADGRRALAVDDVELIETVNPILRAKGIRSLLGVPLLIGDRLLGVLHVGTLARRQFTSEEEQVLQLVGDRIALALDRARLYQEARQAVRIRNEFLSAISHDLGNPVAAIRLESRRLQEAPAGACSPEIREGLSQIEAAAGRMWRQVEELLDLARLQVGRTLEMNWQTVDLVAIVRDLVAAEQGTTDRHQLRLQVDEQQLLGEWDATRLERVITNLLSNAVKYSPEGGDVVVRVSQQRSDEKRRWAVLEVQDSGIGIPAADLPHVFERFYRASNVRGRFAGTGIGLAGARQIVAAHDGDLSVESDEGVGTKVRVRLPLYDLGDEAPE